MDLTVTTPNDVINQLKKMGENIGEIQEKMLESGTAVLKPEIAKNLKQSISGTYSEGNLINSIDTKISSSKSGRSAIVYFKGSTNRTYKNGKTVKVRNGLKAAVLEYGKNGQPPRPFVRPAMQSKKSEIITAMEKTFENETKKYSN